MSNLESENVVAKSIVVGRGISDAFRIWTEEIHQWWPAGHSKSGSPKTRVVLEGKVGGRFYEHMPDGIEYDWGVVVTWEPPHRLAHTWYLGSDPARPTRVEVRFVPLGQDRTRIEIEHRGPELVGELWWLTKSRFSAAWDKVLAEYAASGGVIAG